MKYFIILSFLMVLLAACGDSKCRNLEKQQTEYVQKSVEYINMINIAMKQGDYESVLRYGKELKYCDMKLMDISYQKAALNCKQN